jgi:hypothetical protein
MENQKDYNALMNDGWANVYDFPTTVDSKPARTNSFAASTGCAMDFARISRSVPVAEPEPILYFG